MGFCRNHIIREMKAVLWRWHWLSRFILFEDMHSQLSLDGHLYKTGTYFLFSHFTVQKLPIYKRDPSLRWTTDSLKPTTDTWEVVFAVNNNSRRMCTENDSKLRFAIWEEKSSQYFKKAKRFSIGLQEKRVNFPILFVFQVVDFSYWRKRLQIDLEQTCTSLYTRSAFDLSHWCHSIIIGVRITGVTLYTGVSL